MSSTNEKKADSKELLAEAQQLKFVCMVERLTWKNHETVIHQLCENSVALSNEEQELQWIEWAKKRYLTKVKEEYADDEDCKVKLNRVVWTGRFRDIAREYFESRREGKKKKKERECCNLLCC